MKRGSRSDHAGSVALPLSHMPQVFDRLSGHVRAEDLPTSVANDIVALINASIRGGQLPQVRGTPAFDSVLNFGNAPLARFGAGYIDLQSLANSVKATILMFESRVVSRSLVVTAVIEEGWSSRFRPPSQWPVFCIDGALVSGDRPLRLRMRIDVAHGHACLDQ